MGEVSRPDFVEPRSGNGENLIELVRDAVGLIEDMRSNGFECWRSVWHGDRHPRGLEKGQVVQLVADGDDIAPIYLEMICEPDRGRAFVDLDARDVHDVWFGAEDVCRVAKASAEVFFERVEILWRNADRDFVRGIAESLCDGFAFAVGRRNFPSWSCVAPGVCRDRVIFKIEEPVV